jgi:hypothetical protein
MAEIQGNGTKTPIVNYGVSTREGKIYRSSKTEEVGYTKVEMSSGGVTYHKYLDGLSGKITYLTRDLKEIIGNDGKKKKLDNLKLFLNDSESTQALSLTTYSKEWKLMIKNLYNVDFTKPIVISYYKSKPNELGTQYLNLSVKYDNELTADGKPVYPEWLNVDTVSKGGIVPDPQKNGKGEWDWTDNDLYYLEKLTELTNRFIEFKNKNSTKKEQNNIPIQKNEKSFDILENEELIPEKFDLPF